MRKRKLNGKSYYVFTDKDYEEVVGVHVYLETDDDQEEEENLCCHGCVDRYVGGCPTHIALGIKNQPDRGCQVRICDEEGLADYIAKRLST